MYMYVRVDEPTHLLDRRPGGDNHGLWKLYLNTQAHAANDPSGRRQHFAPRHCFRRKGFAGGASEVHSHTSDSLKDAKYVAPLHRYLDG